MHKLPTIEEAQEFLRVINRGRIAIDLEPLDKLNWADAVPDAPYACLSATNLFSHADLSVFSTHVMNGPHDDLSSLHLTLAHAISADVNAHRQEIEIPDEIRVVTDPFDKRVKGLEERLREAGVI